MIHTLTITPSRKRSDNDVNAAGRFDARIGNHVLVFRSRTPFCDSARKLLATNLAGPDDVIEMRYAGSDHVALRAKVATAAKLTVSETTGHARFVHWQQRPSEFDSVNSPVR